MSKPYLANALEEASRAVRELVAVSDSYAKLKSLLTVLHSAEKPDQDAEEQLKHLTLALRMPGADIQLPLPPIEDREALLAVLNPAGAAMGNQIVTLWKSLHTITQGAVDHCDKALAKASQEQTG